MKTINSLFILLLTFSSCINPKSEPIKLNADKCDNCGMTISDVKFAAELVTNKGRVYKFDDIACMIKYSNENKEKTTSSEFYVSDYIGTHELIMTKNASYIKEETLKSPMGGNTAAFSNTDSAAVWSKKRNTTVTSWDALIK